MKGFGRFGFGWVVFGIAMAVFVAVAAAASGFMETKAEYSADQYMGDGSRVMKSRIYQASGKSRMEMEEGGGSQAIITRMDRKVVWMLMIPEKMYMETPMGKEEKTRDVRQCSYTSPKEAGKETVNGIPATVSEVEATCPDGSSFSGKMWTSREGILVKLDAVAKGSAKEKGQRVLMELKNLKIGKQNPALFEVPAGFAKMEMPTGAPAGGFSLKEMMKPKAEETSKPPAEQPREEGRAYTAQPRAEEKGVLDKALDTKRKLKGLIGW